jgi:hypothetical protein
MFIFLYITVQIHYYFYWDYAAALLAEALPYKPEGTGSIPNRIIGVFN